LLFLPFYDCTVFLPSKSLLNVSCHFGINWVFMVTKHFAYFITVLTSLIYLFLSSFFISFWEHHPFKLENAKIKE
jgi:hypothetical protein